MTARFCAIGHSNLPVEDFVGILWAAMVGLVVDVRSFPRSRSNPDYNIDVLPGRLAAYRIGYRHLPTLGVGRHGKLTPGRHGKLTP